MLPDKLRGEIQDCWNATNSEPLDINVDYTPDKPNLTVRLRYQYSDGDHVERWTSHLNYIFHKYVLDSDYYRSIVVETLVNQLEREVYEQKRDRGLLYQDKNL